MAFSAQSLTPELRAQVLQRLRQELGWPKFNQLVKSLGEDGLVDLYLSQIEQQKSSVEANVATDQRPKSILAHIAACSFLAAFGLGVFLWFFESMFTGPITDWPWLMLILGLIGTIIDGLMLYHLRTRDSKPADDSPNQKTDSAGSNSSPPDFGDILSSLCAIPDFLMALVAWVYLALVFVIGVLGGPVLFIWGVVNLVTS